ncbi:MAG: hypothetical protein GY778_06745 [bacterium]|nr:hypothetical protein [bacterium]
MNRVSSTGADTTGTGGGTTGTGGGEKGNATLILVLGIVGLLCCNLLGPVVWYMGKQEMQGIAEGRIPAANEGTAKAGMILGIICTALLVIGCVVGILWLIFGGLAVLGEAMAQ